MTFKKTGSMENDWKVAYMTGDNYRAEMARQILGQNGIEAVIMNRKDTAHASFGDIEVFVKEENEESARELLKELES